MIKLADYCTEKAFPEKMRTPERIALAYAFDVQKKKFIERMERVYIWADMENVDDNKLDFLAVENRVLFYNTGLTPAVKRNLIRNSVYWYMKLGTRQAMEEMVNIVFKNDSLAFIEEWYLYGGDPYHFRLILDIDTFQTYVNEFLYYLYTIKNARSRFDYIGYIKKIEISTTESVIITSVLINFKLLFWKDKKCLDGIWLLDGSTIFNGLHVPFNVKPIITYPISMDTNMLTNTFLIQKINLWYLNGIQLFNGTKLLNAKITEEVL